MATPYDASAKDLIEFAPADWLAFLGQPRPPKLVRVIDADLSATVSTATDKVVRVDDAEPWLVMIEMQAAWDGDLPFDLLRRYSLLRHRHRLPVSCVVILLRPEANTSKMTGAFSQHNPLGNDWDFPFQVIRVWELPTDRIAMGPLAVLPLAPLTAVDEERVSSVLSMMNARTNREATRAQAETLWTATFQLLALRFGNEQIELWKDVMKTLDISNTPLVKFVERRAAEAARLEQARDDIERIGRKKFSEPATPAIKSALNSIDTLDRLNRLTERLLDVSSWQELLAEVP